jgi:Raf kinase inhibitor-like YbhB/YbcL family protein
MTTVLPQARARVVRCIAMMRTRFAATLPLVGIFLASTLGAPRPAAAAPAALTVTLEGLLPSGNLPISAAFCLPKGSDQKPQDRSPGLRWSAGPAGTKSYVVIMVDPDVTANLALMNKPGVTIPVDSPRQNIYHWELIDIPPSVTSLAPGEDGDGFVPGGKPIGPGTVGIRGTNDYWPLFNNNPNMPPAMAGPYGGYDGPCPPSNDLKVHTYRFQVYALDVPTLGLSGKFFALAVISAMNGHILAQGEADAKFTFDGT